MNENKKIKKVPVLYILPVVLLILSVFAAVFRGIVLFKFTDYTNGLYTDNTAGNIFFVVLAVLIAVTAVLYVPLKKTDFFNGSANLKHGAFSKIISAVCAVMLVAVLVKDAASLISGSFSLLLAAEAVLCIPSAMYFISNITSNKYSVTHGILALFPALYAAIHTIILFIDTTTQINASQRSFTLLMLVFLMMFFVTEAEFYIPLGTEEKSNGATGKRCAKFVVIGLIAAELSIIIAVPGIMFSAVVMNDIGAVIYGVAHLSLGIYAITK